MLDWRPYAGMEEVINAAGTAFDVLGESDWLEAFSGHPRIGEKGDRTANQEQAGVRDAASDTLTAIADANRKHEERFGFTYIVYASGKSAEEMLSLAEARLEGTKEEEIETASREQRAITDTRLRRMLCGGDQQ